MPVVLASFEREPRAPYSSTLLCGQCLLAAALLQATPAQKRPSAATFEDPFAEARREETNRLLRLAGTPLWKEGNPFPYYGARAASQRLAWFVRRHRDKPPHEVISAILDKLTGERKQEFMDKLGPQAGGGEASPSSSSISATSSTRAE